MSSRGKRLVSMLCVLALLAGLLVTPVGAAVPMMGDHVHEEIPVGEEVSSPRSGTMPEHDHSSAVVDPSLNDEEDGGQSATLLAVQAEHTHSFNDGKLTSGFYTFDKGGSAPSTTTKDTPATITTSDGKSLTINKALKMESATTITFTAPEDGQLTIYCGNASGTSFKLGSETYAVTNGKAVIPTSKGACVVGRGSGESHVVYLEWQSAGCEVHTWGTTYTQVTAPTCTEPGAEANKCTVCGAVNTETRPIAKLGHNFQNYVQTKAPTCASEGLETGKCSRCDATDTRAVAATGNHNISGGKCTVCGLLEGKTPCVTHTMGTPAVTPATCTTPGESKETCSVCGMTVSTVLPATGHAWGEWSEKTAATCQTEGVEARKCSKCQEEETRSTGFGPHQFNGSTCTICGATAGIEAGGWFETLYAEIDGVTDRQVTAVKYTGPMSGALVGEDLEFLVRDATLSSGKSGVRIDIPGLIPGVYNLEVQAGGKFVANNIQVLAHDRSGYAHYNYTEGVGAYRDDGILKEDAIVLYVTEETKNAVTVTAPDGTTVTGIGNILNSVGAHPKSGGKANSNQDVLQKLADADIPLVVRIIGKVTSTEVTPSIDGLTAWASVDYGGTDNDNGNMARMKSAKNITIEGIGTDAEVYGWGFHFIAAGNDPDAGRGRGFEVRNISFRQVPEDCVGMEGQYEGGKFSPVQRGWVHNCNFYAAKNIQYAGSESDKSEGDGSCDFKRGEYFTMSYCYFEGCHKTNLVGSGDSDAAGPQYHITWHHNHWVNCKARGPLSRKANIHIYNNIYEHQTDYAQNPRVNTYIFSEYNTFINCKQPRLLTSGGVIKSYMDALGSNITDDAGVNTVTDKSQTVSSANAYANFDTKTDLSYIPAGDYQLDPSTLEARAKIYAYGGPMKAAKDMVDPSEVHALTVAKEYMPTAAVTLPYDQAINSSYVTGSAVKDNIVFNGGAGNSSGYKFTKSTTGQNVVFTVKESVNVTVEGTGICLISAETGGTVLNEGGTASGLPAGTYYIQPNNFQPGDTTGAGFSFKDGTVTSLSIQAATQPPHVHSYSTTGTVAKEATCSATGLMRYNCTGCDEYKVEVIPMTAHNYVGGYCTMCGLADSVLDDPSITYDPVQSVSVDPTSVTIEQGNSATLTATVLPSTAKGTVAWSTSDASVATVSRGVVVGKGAGTATITATSVEDSSKLATCQVEVVGVTTKTYTFAAKDYSNYANDQSLPAGTKLGTDDYFTTTGNNTWRTEAANKPQSLLTASQGASGMSFTVAAGATAQSVTISVCSTGTSNYSSVALIDAAGNRVADAKGKTVQVVQTKSGTTITFNNLSAGTYTIVSPKVDNAADVGLSDITANANNVNSRGVRIINISVTEAKRSDGTASVPVSAVTLDKTAVSLEKGQSVKLTATVKPDNASNKNVTWTTSKASVATVNGGTVYAAGEGIATITASCGGKSATATITVNSSSSTIVAVTGVTLNKTAAELKVGGTETLTATVAPANATDKTLSWTSSNNAVATVVGGVVTARGAGTATITATAGGHSDTCTVTVKVDEVPEEHDFQWVQTKAPSCTEKGQESYTCTKCGTVSQVRDIPALVHAWSAWKVVKAPTCTVDGESERVCATCQTKETDPLEAPGHSYGAWEVSKPATCQETGVRVHFCTVCQASEDEDIALLDHDWGEWIVTLEPTCTQAGERAQICAVGGERNTEEVAALGHNFEDGKCTRCQMSEDVAEHDCTWTAWTAVAGKAATCTTAGQEERSCTVTGCGAKEIRDVAALGHAFGAWTTTKDATCTEKGAESRKCTRCDVTESREIAARGHSYGEDGTCTVCGASQSAVSVAVTGVSLDKSQASVTVGGTVTLTASIEPVNATNKNVTWSSSNESVATVKDGVVTGKSVGTATITVTTVDGSRTATCSINVTRGGGGGGSSVSKPAEQKPETAKLPFVDVAMTDWYYDTVAKAFEKGLMKGTDASHFAPELSTSRAMIATILFRLDGEKKTDVRAAFDDVASGVWYTEAVAWAAEKGVVKGYSEDIFAPNDDITREQLAVMLYRYASASEKAMDGKKATLSDFVDAGKVSGWAVEAMEWAVRTGIITGKGARDLDPQGRASRAEAVTMLMRYVDLQK